ncbi:MAG TPA: hypothetical protein EYG21_00435 [Nitrospinaceae bacterium]|jgi:uncharacterized protein YeeX (DUF496 family)|nr:hypothetical protein [Nitrospinaceae bacterium]
MDIDELIQRAVGSELLDEQTCNEVLNYGISEFLKAGVSYEEALDIIENARVNYERIRYQRQFGPRATIEEEGDAP